MKNSKSILFLIISVCALSFPASNLYSFVPEDKNSKKEIDSIDNNEKSKYTLSLGMGYHYDDLFKDLTRRSQIYSKGFIWSILADGKLDQEGNWLIEVLMSKWYGWKVNDKKIWENIKSDYMFSVCIKYNIINFNDDYLFFIHFGGSPIPLISWDIGLDVDYNLYQSKLFLGLSSRVILVPAIADHVENEYSFPSYVILCLKYAI